MADPKPSTSAPISQFTGVAKSDTGTRGIAWRPSSNTFFVTRAVGGGTYQVYEYTPTGTLVTSWNAAGARNDVTFDRTDDTDVWLCGTQIQKWNVVTKTLSASWSITGMALTLSIWRGIAWLAGDYYYAYYRSSSPTTYRLCKVAKATNVVVAEVVRTPVTGHPQPFGIEVLGSTVYWISDNNSSTDPETAVSLYSAVDLAFQETIILHPNVPRGGGIAYNDEHFWVRDYGGTVFKIGATAPATARPRRWVCII